MKTSHIPTTDNHSKNLTDEQCNDHLDNLQRIAGIKIADINLEESQNLLVFPQCFSESKDRIGSERIFELENNKLHTGNIMGFVGVNGSELKISSRFAQKDKPDYFLHYMLQKVFSINLFDMKHSLEREEVFDFLLYLFPYYLKKALRQGLFKEYQHKEYNDANVRGAIDVNRHIRQNIPFAGKVAYRTREYISDNRITQLIRHTIEHIRQHPFGGNILRNDDDTIQGINQILFVTPSYNQRDRQRIVNNNLKPLAHPFYGAYLELQQICLRILRSEGLKYGEEKDKVYGILFDGAWLWEEYLYTILKKIGFKHSENKCQLGKKFLFSNGSYARYLDFWNDDIVLDAKYKRLNKSDINREDMHQVIAYMYITESKHGGFIHPTDDGEKKAYCIGDLNGYGGTMFCYPVNIPQAVNDFSDFASQIEDEEKLLINHISKKYNTQI